MCVELIIGNMEHIKYCTTQHIVIDCWPMRSCNDLPLRNICHMGCYGDTYRPAFFCPSHIGLRTMCVFRENGKPQNSYGNGVTIKASCNDLIQLLKRNDVCTQKPFEIHVTQWTTRNWCIGIVTSNWFLNKCDWNRKYQSVLNVQWGNVWASRPSLTAHVSHHVWLIYPCPPTANNYLVHCCSILDIETIAWCTDTINPVFYRLILNCRSVSTVYYGYIT